MIRKTYINGDMAALVTAIQNSGFLKSGESVSYDNQTKTLTITSGAITLFTLALSGTSDSIITWRAYADAENYAEGHLGGASGGASPYIGYVRYLMSCNGGLIFDIHRKGFSESAFFHSIRVLRTNFDQMAFVFYANNDAAGTATNVYTSQHCIAWGDVPPFATITLGQTVRPVAEVASMLSNGDYEAMSYTRTGGYLAYYNDRTAKLSALDINGHHFITDGTIAIEDVVE